MAKTRDPKRFERTAKGRRVLRQRAQMRRATQKSPPDHNDNTQAAEKQWSMPAVTQGHPFFQVLPPELRFSILSLLHPKDVEASHQACQEFHGIVEAFDLVDYKTKYHLQRLQSSLDTINAARMPTDVDSLLASMRIWISTRGLFCDGDLSYESWTKWFSHLANGDVRSPPGVPPKLFEQWAWLATMATSLQFRVNQSDADHTRYETDDYDGDLALLEWFEAAPMTHAIPIDEIDLFKLFGEIRWARGRVLTGTWHTVRKERATFPGNLEGQVGRRRLTSIRLVVGSDPNRPDSSRHPLRPANIMLANMDLPPLPPHNTFCYYITNEVLYAKIIKSSPDPLQMTPAMRAAALAHVELF